MSSSTRDDQPRLDAPDEWAALQALLSNCLKHPEDSLRTAIRDGSLEADLDRLTTAVGIDRPSPVPDLQDRDLTEDYEGVFGAFYQPFAPPAASPYKEWYGDTDGGLMDGPPASRMEERFEALEVAIPDAYPPDHVSLQLEYASLLAEMEAFEELAAFVETELDWIDAFASMVEEAAAKAPFHRYCVELLVAAVAALREQFGVEPPSETTVERMIERSQSQRI